MNLENKRFTLEDDSTYEVIEYVKHNSKLYVYLVNIDDEIDSEFKELVLDNNGIYLNDIDSNLFQNEIYNLFLKKFKSY